MENRKNHAFPNGIIPDGTEAMAPAAGQTIGFALREHGSLRAGSSSLTPRSGAAPYWTKSSINF